MESIIIMKFNFSAKMLHHTVVSCRFSTDTFINSNLELGLMKPAEALRIVDLFSKEIEVEDTHFSLVRLRTCV